MAAVASSTAPAPVDKGPGEHPAITSVVTR
jgi:hypothetical protein